MDRVFVIGDIHGAYRALRQCLQRSAFDYVNDRLICLGDVADGWPETKESVDELLKIKNLTYILGNHDWWTLQWILSGEINDAWYSQGGKATIDSYDATVPPSHSAFFADAVLYHLYKNKLFVHAGIDPVIPLESQDPHTFLWDRKLASLAFGSPEKERISAFDEIYIGHTPVSSPHPVCSRGVWFMDTGAGWSGVLSIMNVDTKEIFTSDPVGVLYPGIQGRQRNR